MESNHRRFDTQKHYNYIIPTSSPSSSSLNYSYLSNQPMIHGLHGMVPMREAPALMLVQPLRSYYPCEADMRLHGEQFSPYGITVPVAREERYGGGGYHYGDVRSLEAVQAPVPLHRMPPSSDQLIMLPKPKPTGANVSGSKRQVSPPYSISPSVANSSGIGSKKITEEWKCTVCNITATSEHGLNDHLAGKKHQAKVDSLKGNNTSTGGDIGLGVMKTSMKAPMKISAKKQTLEVKSLKGNNNNITGGEIGLGVTRSVTNVKKSDGRKMRKKYKFWCKMCKTGAYDEVVMRDHKKGKKHLKNRRMKAKERAQRKSDE